MTFQRGIERVTCVLCKGPLAPGEAVRRRGGEGYIHRNGCPGGDVAAPSRRFQSPARRSAVPTRVGLPPGAVPVTTTRLAVLDAVVVLPHPTVLAVAAHVGHNPSTVYYELARLAELGFVSKWQGKRGAIRPFYRLCPVVSPLGA